MTRTELYIGMLPSAIDLWFAIIAMCEIFDKHVPWWIWVMLLLEIISAASSANKLRSAT